MSFLCRPTPAPKTPRRLPCTANWASAKTCCTSTSTCRRYALFVRVSNSGHTKALHTIALLTPPHPSVKSSEEQSGTATAGKVPAAQELDFSALRHQARQFAQQVIHQLLY